MTDLRLYGTVLASAAELQKVVDAGSKDGYDRLLPAYDFDTERLSVIVAKAVLNHVGGRSIEPYLRCYALVAVAGQCQPIEVTHVDVPLCLYAEMEVPDSVRVEEDAKIANAIRFNI